ncbi:MAG TPA: hypothetical protein VEO18_01285 [Thermoplasmata archaeon]|nr:hypothetical protein [Thermoplasmata archaeon]
MEAKEQDLREWVLSHMTTEAGSELDLYKEQVAKLLSLTSTGDVIFNVDRTKLDQPTEILLLLIGKAYARIAGLAATDVLTNNELVKLATGSSGGQRWALTKLREESLITSTAPGTHHILPSQIGRALKRIGEKITP